MNIVEKEIFLGEGNLTVMVKDSIDIQGFTTNLGSRTFDQSEPAKRNAVVVNRILDAKCKIVAKTNLHELAFGITGINHAFGTAINPKYPELIPGGSSSGSAAAVAARLADFTLGTDTGGSIRMPAACCGVFGLKPTFDRISREGIHPSESTLDCVGPFANSIEMIELAMKIIDPSFQAITKNIEAPKLAMLNVVASNEVQTCISDYLEQGNIIFDFTEVSSFDDAFHAGMKIINFENWQAYGALTETELLGVDIQGRLLKAKETTKEDVYNALIVKKIFTQEIDALLEKYDALLLPTLPQIPPFLVEAENTVAFLNLTGLVRPFNLSGHPAISVPLETKDGFPVGLQIVSKRYFDEQLCAIAKFIVHACQK